jgi:hypothetical protein
MARKTTMRSLMIRPGDEGDEPVVLALFDEAVAWLVERGQAGQWGAVAFSERSHARERVTDSPSAEGPTLPNSKASRSALS